MAWRQALLAPLKLFASVAFYALAAFLAGAIAVVVGVKILAGSGWAFIAGGVLALVVGVWILIGIARSAP